MNPHAQALGKLGGEKSASSRFKGMTKEQISQAMKDVRSKTKKRDIIKKV